MASDRRSLSGTGAVARRRTAAAQAAAVLGGRPLDPRQRRPLESPLDAEEGARAISQSFNLLAAAAGVDRQRRVPRSLEASARKTRPAPGAPLEGGDRRRLVFTGPFLHRKAGGGAEVGDGRKGKGTTIMLMVDGEGTPLSAFTSEVHAIETLVDDRVATNKPWHLMSDKAADADWLRDALDVRGIALICAGRTKPPLQDGRALRRYKRRYKVERSIRWLHNCRRLITRWEILSRTVRKLCSSRLPVHDPQEVLKLPHVPLNVRSNPSHKPYVL